MARVIKPEVYHARKREILDVAQRLILLSKGYTGMAVQDILDDLHISKGAFYHYFDSKQALLEALIERLVSEAMPMLTTIIDDPGLPALDKLHAFFGAAARWKTQRRDFLMALLQVWYADENAIVREKLRAAMPERYGPLLARVIRQGVDEGVMSARHPDRVASLVFRMLIDLGYDFAVLLGQAQQDEHAIKTLVEIASTYDRAIERVLGMTKGSLELVDSQTIHAWFDPMLVSIEPSPQAGGGRPSAEGGARLA